uniref:Uncharacterized protein n=1 Tax=Arundo donax TaxID=35708 RepID=A0A0A9BH10_ARUDO
MGSGIMRGEKAWRRLDLE